jgi:hypothetical protein
MARGVSEKLLASLPVNYRPGFVDLMDRRTVMGRAIHSRIEEMETDLGGSEALSHIRRSLVRRAVWLELAIEAHEYEFAEGRGVDMGGYTQALNSYLGVCRQLGLDRKAKPTRGLQARMAASQREPIEGTKA